MEDLSEQIDVGEGDQPGSWFGGKKSDANSPGWHIIKLMLEIPSSELFGIGVVLSVRKPSLCRLNQTHGENAHLRLNNPS
jgi:hypothetical protein